MTTRTSSSAQTHLPAAPLAQERCQARRHVRRFFAVSLSALAVLVSGAASLSAQDSSGQGTYTGCVATVKSRSVLIDPSGAYAIPNVPVDSGKYRVRVVCPPSPATGVVSGSTSDPVPLVPNGTEAIPQLPLTPLTAQPNKVSLVNIGQATLGSLGATIQLQAQLIFPNSVIFDGTGSSNGTTYILQQYGGRHRQHRRPRHRHRSRHGRHHRAERRPDLYHPAHVILFAG